MTAWRPLAFVVGVTALGLLPFVGKAFHVDDPQFLWTARQILRSPTDFFGFPINWYGFDAPMSEIAANPPLASYYIALVVALAGWHEVALHLAFLLPAVAAAAGTFRLARRFCARPLLATLIAVGSPAFLVGSTNVMVDTLLLAFWVWAMELWMLGIDRAAPRYHLAAAVLVALAALTKYYGVALVPLLAAWSLLRRRRATPELVWLGIPIVALGAYDLYTLWLYERGQLFEAAFQASGARSTAGRSVIARAVIGLAFTGGSLATAALYTPLAWSWPTLGAGALATAAAVVAIPYSDTLLPYPWLARAGVPWAVIVQLAVLGLAGVHVLALAVADIRARRDASAWLLLVWTIGGFVFAAFVNATINARSILLIAPAAGILVARRLEHRCAGGGSQRLWPVAAPLIAGGALALSLAWTDYELAGSARRAASMITRQHAGDSGVVWFQGHWGFQYYMEVLGGRAIDRRRLALAPGDLIVIPGNNTNTFPMPGLPASVERVIELPVRGWLTTLSPLRGGGFYSEFIGPLPFAVGPPPPERYQILRLTAPPSHDPATR